MAGDGGRGSAYSVTLSMEIADVRDWLCDSSNMEGKEVGGISETFSFLVYIMVRYMSPEFRKEVWIKNINFVFINM